MTHPISVLTWHDVIACHRTDLEVHLFQDKATSLAWGYNHCIEVGLRWKNFWKYPEALRYVSSKLITYIAFRSPSPLEQILPNLKQHLLFISSSLHPWAKVTQEISLTLLQNQHRKPTNVLRTNHRKLIHQVRQGAVLGSTMFSAKALQGLASGSTVVGKE